MQPTDLNTPICEMRARYDRDGYIWIKNLIPREVVYDIREQSVPLAFPTLPSHPSRNPDHPKASFLTRLSSHSYFTLLPHHQHPRPPHASASSTRPTADPLTPRPTSTRPLTTTPSSRSHASGPSIRHFTGWECRNQAPVRAVLRHNCPGKPAARRIQPR